MRERHTRWPPAPSRLALVLALAACDGGTDVPVPATLSVSPTEATLEAVGATRQFSASVQDAGGTLIPDANVTWSSSRSDVATVNGEGLATAVGTGATTITASAGAASGSATLTVALAAFSCLPSEGTPVGAMAVGELSIVTDAQDFCLTFPAVAGQHYLVGVQSIEQNGEQTTPVLVRSSATGAATAPAAAAAAAERGARISRAGSGSLARLSDPAIRRRRAWRDQHAQRLARDVEYLRGLGGPGLLPAPFPAPQRAIVSPDLQLGDTVTLRVRHADAQCGTGDFDNVMAELVWKGARAWWFDDVANPDAFTIADWQALGDQFDDLTDPVVTEYFGQPSDIDGNGVIVVLFTRALNQRGEDDEGITTLGFVNPCDFVGREFLATSNEGEFFYHIAADPAGTVGDTVSTEALLENTQFTIAHEYTHIIQFSRRFEAGSPLMDIFMAEGQATLAEEVVGHQALGNRPGQNYGVQVAFGEEGGDWYANAFVDLFFYYGLDIDVPADVPDAPEECSWTSEETPDPCHGRSLWYGVTWSLLRWASDQFGGRFAGGEVELQQRLVDNNLTGFANLADVTGESVSSLLGHWAPMLYMDDRIQGLDTRLRMTSWNLFDIYNGLNPDLEPFLQPLPRPRTTTDWEDSFTVRSPSFEWYTLTTTGQEATLRVTNQARALLPAHMQLFVVRVR